MSDPVGLYRVQRGPGSGELRVRRAFPSEIAPGMSLLHWMAGQVAARWPEEIWTPESPSMIVDLAEGLIAECDKRLDVESCPTR